MLISFKPTNDMDYVLRSIILIILIFVVSYFYLVKSENSGKKNENFRTYSHTQ
jgi:preprotein translocase subunit YajC